MKTATRFADKAWANVSRPTIPNCFRHCGFLKEGMMSIQQEAEGLVPNDAVEGYNTHFHGGDEIRPHLISSFILITILLLREL